MLMLRSRSKSDQLITLDSTSSLFGTMPEKTRQFE
jgi:hypothetical protein